MITFKGVTKNYKDNVGLDDVSLHIKKGEFGMVRRASGRTGMKAAAGRDCLDGGRDCPYFSALPRRFIRQHGDFF